MSDSTAATTSADLRACASVTPYGFISRLAGRDPLRRRGGGGESYWVERKRTRQGREQFERLF